MTIKEELEIYQRMLKASRRQYWRPFKSEYYGFTGFCGCLIYETELRRLHELTVLMSLKPIKTYDRGYWFKPYKMSPRIKLLKKAIKICNKKLNQ